MKKRIVMFTSIVIIFSLMIMTSLYFVISNHKYIESSKNILLEHNRILKVLILENDSRLDEKFQDLKDESDVRITYIDNDGTVIFDSHKSADIMENHADRPEVRDARENEVGTSVRYSAELKKDMIYYALALEDGKVIRSSIPLDSAKIFKDVNLMYYLVALIISTVIAIILSLKITNIIIDPLKELEFITARIANGEVNRRVTIRSMDELASLGKSFNHMADRLEESLDELIDKQNRLEAILKSMDSGVIAIDRYFKFIMINPYAKKIFGVKGDVIGKRFTKYISEEAVLNALKNREERVEITINAPEARILRIRTADIINGHEHIGTVAVIQDITDIKKLENMRSQFVANISHELKTPLTSIKGFAETLRYVDDEETRNKFLDIIDDESDRLARLIQDILVLYDIEQNRDPVFKPFSTNNIIDSVGLMVLNEAKNKNITVNVNLCEDTEIIGDKDKFKQMILNLVYNAVKYTENNGTVYVSTYQETNDLVIEVKDTGIGISEEDLPRIFERFYRVDKARSRNSGGTGLGLAIVKHIVIAFEGKIEVKSEVGVGTRFIIHIPIKREIL